MAAVIELDADELDVVPFAFVAVTVNVYPVPAVNPEIVNGEDSPVCVNEPGDDVTVYVVDFPPLAFGVNDTIADGADPYAMFEVSAAETELGRSGIVVAVIADEGADASEFPYELVAVTVNV